MSPWSQPYAATWTVDPPAAATAAATRDEAGSFTGATDPASSTPIGNPSSLRRCSTEASSVGIGGITFATPRMMNEFSIWFEIVGTGEFTMTEASSQTNTSVPAMAMADPAAASRCAIR